MFIKKIFCLFTFLGIKIFKVAKLQNLIEVTDLTYKTERALILAKQDSEKIL